MNILPEVTMLQNYFITIIILVTFFSKNTLSVQISCKNQSIPINVLVGTELEFQCETSKTFHSCVIERKSNDFKQSQCNFTFYSPIQFFPGSVRTKELQKVQWNCGLDSNQPYRLQALETTNERKCHIKITSVGVNGKVMLDVKLSSRFNANQSIIRTPINTQPFFV